MNRAPPIRAMPRRKAPIRKILLKKRRVKSTGRLDLQLNPWNSLAMHRVPKAHGAGRVSAALGEADQESTGGGGPDERPSKPMPC